MNNINHSSSIRKGRIGAPVIARSGNSMTSVIGTPQVIDNNQEVTT